LRKVITLFFVVITFNYSAFCEELLPFNLDPLFGKERIHYLETNPVGNIVSLTEKEPSVFVACDYGNLFEIDIVNKKIKKIEKPKEVSYWNPTGVFFNEKNKKLYIANYQGHNIIILNLKDKGNFVFEKEIKFQGLISPENVAVSDDGKFIAIADYNAEKIFLVDEEGKVKWSQDVKLAHGVCIEPDGSAIYSLGLNAIEGQIYKFNNNGELLAKRARPEIYEKTNFFSYPTHCALSSKGDLYYIEAHAGSIIKVNKDTLERDTILGSYGPLFNQINTSYGFAFEDKGHIFLSDMYKKRFLEINPEKGEIINVFSYDSNNEEGENPSNISKEYEQKYSKDTKKYTEKKYINMSTSFLNTTGWTSGYKRIFNDSSKKILDLRIEPSIFRRKFLRFIDLQSFDYKGKVYTVISSPQSAEAILITDTIAVPLSVGPNFWLEDKNEYGHLTKLIQNSIDKITEYTASIRSGSSPINTMHKVFFKEVHPDFDVFQQLFASTFTNEERKNMGFALLNAKSKESVSEIYSKYVALLQNESNIPLDELLLMTLIKYTAEKRIENIWDRMWNFINSFSIQNDKTSSSSKNLIKLES
jgi:DNA-binding beta-propeller fold protein YncE